MDFQAALNETLDDLKALAYAKAILAAKYGESLQKIKSLEAENQKLKDKNKSPK